MGEIKATGSFVPSKKVSNDDLSKIIDTNDEWIVSHTGIKFRHIATDDETTSFMASRAGETALNRSGLSAEDIDMILVATSTPDYNHFPSTACLVQKELGLVNSGALDIAAACTGFIYALETARAYINAGTFRNIMVIGVDKLTTATNWADRKTAILFGDGAGAIIMSAETGNGSGVKNSILKADGNRGSSLTYKAGGSSFHPKKRELAESEYYIEMDGRAIYDFAVDIHWRLIQQIMEKNNVTIDDIRWIVPHQANARIIQASVKRGKIPLEKVYLNIDQYANTSAATIPIAINELAETGNLSKGDKVITVGFGGGLTFGGNYIVW
jgi:3-oxoacyl-[acyl-carrier-protein] synthase-3